MRIVKIESECVVENLDFPKHLDHAWLFIASGIHGRLYEKRPNGPPLPGVVRTIRESTAKKHLLTIDSKRGWSDGVPIVAQEVANALSRGLRVGLFESVRATLIDRVEVVMQDDLTLDHELLASPLFTLTPSCRAVGEKTATCGPYVLSFCSPDKHVMTFRKRQETEIIEGPTEISIIVTESRCQGLRLLQAKHLTLSCPLGANPEEFSRLGSTNTVTNRLTNLGLVLRPYPNCAIARDKKAISRISHAVDRDVLARMTAGTFVPMTTVSRLFDTSGHCNTSDADERLSDDAHAERVDGNINHIKILELQYAPFEPNKQIAEEIARQLHSKLDIRCRLTPVPYADYIASTYPDRNGISLEILQPFLPEKVCRAKWHIADEMTCGDVESTQLDDTGNIPTRDERPVAIPLLQGVTSLISLDPRYRGMQLLNEEAVIDWCRL